MVDKSKLNVIYFANNKDVTNTIIINFNFNNFELWQM